MLLLLPGFCVGLVYSGIFLLSVWPVYTKALFMPAMPEVLTNSTVPAANELPNLPPAVYSDVLLDQSQPLPLLVYLNAFERLEGACPVQ